MRFSRKGNGSLLAAVATGALLLAVPSVSAQERQKYEFNMPEQDLGEALRSVSRQLGKEILFPTESVAGRRAPPLQGSYTTEEAVRALTAGTDLVVDFRSDGILIRGRSQTSSELSDRSTNNAEAILVTGSRIAGGTVTSPVIVLGRREIADAGYSNLGDVIRAIPQNFAGGQNPTVAGGGIQGAANQNVTSASTFNLRGLGPDATLTLLNGHRMPYDGIFQGVDISSIPIAAIDRIEIVPDGSSAIYGSDAVGGVANILLRRSFHGLEGSLRYGGSTEGGNQQVEAGAVAGAEWRSGGIMAGFDFSRQTAILAGDRAFARPMQATQTLVPWQRQYSGIASGYQEIGGGVRFEFDATYNHRESAIQTPTSNAASYLASGSLSALQVETFTVSPTLRLDLGSSWEAYVMGTYGESRAFLNSRLFTAGSPFFNVLVDYDNALKSVEAGASGSLLQLPGGAMKLALGGGYRSNTLDTFVRSGATLSTLRATMDFSRGRDSWYAFAELNAPLVGPDNAGPLLRRLVVTGAVRYENYPEIGEVVTPKAGLLYSPFEELDLKVSWGQSFKAPTLYQQFQTKQVILRLATAYGTSQFPSGATVLGLSGGNSDSLDPERADNFTASLTLRPRALPGARLELGYFRIRYRDRIISPIPSNLGLFANPLYAPFITYAPSPAQIASAIVDAPAGVTVSSGGPYDPAKVVAIVDNRQNNASRQDIQGLDLSGRYEFSTAGGKLSWLGSVSYLESSQILVAGQSAVMLAGTIYNPASWRFRTGAQWDRGGFTASTYVNFVGASRDRRISAERGVPSFTTLDAAITYRVERAGSALDGLEVELSASNLLDAAPGAIRQSSTIEPVYDSTNASPVGRFLSLSVRKRW